MKRFALIRYAKTANLGDEIQSLAARQFLPQTDATVDREWLHTFRPEGGTPHWLILNGWYCHLPENWPPSPALQPLPVSLHISPDPGGADGIGLVAEDILLSPPFRKYLAGFGPVGARDLATLKRLQAAGIDSYFSGCLTLTLTRRDVARDDGLVVLNDVPDEVEAAIRKTTGKRIATTQHWNEHTTDSGERFELAEALLRTYSEASCVVTTRLHCALPCVAMGTPVLLLDTAEDQHRFAGLHDFVRHATPGRFLAGDAGFDVNHPPPNPEDYQPYAFDLRERVRQFIAAPASEARPYPLTPQDLEDGLRLINRRTAALVIHERSARHEL